MKNSLQLFFVGLLSIAPLIVNASECSLKVDGPVMAARPFAGLDRDLNCTFVNQVESLISEIQKFSETPLKVNLLVRIAHSGASYDGGSNLEIAEQLVFDGNWGQEYGGSHYSNMSVVAHEYGHALLQDKMEKELSKKYPVVKEYSLAKKELSKIEMELAKNPSSESLQQLLKDKTAAMINNKAFTKFFVLGGPYSELYADVVAVFNENSKGAIYNALYYDQMSKFAFRMIHARDFDSEFDQKYETFMTEAHGYFAHTRTYIGKNLWPTNNEEKKVYLHLIGDAIIAEMDKLMSTDSDLLEFPEGNKSLIARLSQLKKNNL